MARAGRDLMKQLPAGIRCPQYLEGSAGGRVASSRTLALRCGASAFQAVVSATNWLAVVRALVRMAED